MKALALAGSILVLALLSAGCGGDDEESGAGTTAETQPTAEAWADDVCSRVQAWGQDLRDVVAAPGEGSATERIRQKVDDAATATNALLDDLKAIGPPATDQGAEAKSEIDDLADGMKERIDRLQSQAQDIEGTSDALQFSANVATELDGAQQEARQTFDDVRELDPSGELRDGIDNSEACDELRSSVS